MSLNWQLFYLELMKNLPCQMYEFSYLDTLHEIIFLVSVQECLKT